MRRTKKRGNHIGLAFLATIAILALLVGGFYLIGGLGPGVPVRSIPQSFPPYAGLIGKFAPENSLVVSYDNLSAVRAINSSALGSQVFLNLIEPPLVLQTGQINVRISMGLSNPNASVNIALLSNGAFQSAVDAFAKTNLSPTVYGGFNIYSVADKTIVNETAYFIVLLPLDHGIIFSPGATPALYGTESVISVYNGGASSILTRTDVQRMLYTVNGTRHLALGFQNFPGEVRSGLGTLITVDNTNTSLKINYVVKFPDSATAQSQVGTVRTDYLAARYFAVYDELVRGTETQPLSGLRAAVGLVG